MGAGRQLQVWGSQPVAAVRPWEPGADAVSLAARPPGAGYRPAVVGARLAVVPGLASAARLVVVATATTGALLAAARLWAAAPASAAPLPAAALPLALAPGLAATALAATALAATGLAVEPAAAKLVLAEAPLVAAVGVVLAAVMAVGGEALPAWCTCDHRAVPPPSSRGLCLSRSV